MLVDLKSDKYYESIVAGCYYEENLFDEYDAVDTVDKMFAATLRFLLDDFDKIMRDIKHKINVYLTLVIGRARFLLNHDEDMGGYVEQTLKFLIEEFHETDPDTYLINDAKSLFNIYTQTYIDKKSLSFSKSIHTIERAEATEDVQLSEDDIRQAREKQLKDELDAKGLIRTAKHGQVIERIFAVSENMSYYNELTGTVNKREELRRAESILRRFTGRSPAFDKMYLEQLERIGNFKMQNIALNNEKLERLLSCLDFIVNNKDEILEREMSIELFGDSKFFEKGLKSKVCSLLEKYCSAGLDDSLNDDKSLKREKILSDFMIVKNPTYFYFKGNGQIIFEDATKSDLSYRRPIALSSDSIKDIAFITTSCAAVMTIESTVYVPRICFVCFSAVITTPQKPSF